MTKVVIFQNNEGGVAIFHPAPAAVEQYGLAAIAGAVVPAGKPYKIIDAADVPADRSLRDAWTVDEADLTDGVGADYNTMDEVQDGSGT